MAIIKGIFSLSILLFFSTISNAQTFKVRTLDGTSQEVRFVHEVGDQKLLITNLIDTIIIDDFTELSEDISILKESFLAIHYKIRIGSDQSRERLLLLCVNKNKLCQTLHIVSLSTYDVVNVYDKVADSLRLFDEHESYRIKINLIGSDKDQFKLNVNVYDQSKSKRNPNTDHNYNKTEVLSFNANKCLFYSTHKDLSTYFMIYDPKTQNKSKQFIIGTFPIVKLGNINYYFIRNNWYEEGYDDNLIGYTYK